MIKKYEYVLEKERDIYFFWMSKHKKTKLAVESYMKGEATLYDTCIRFHIIHSTITKHLKKMLELELIFQYSPYRNTLDIDNNDKYLIKKMIQKIRRCKNLVKVKIKPSELKGIHIILFCSIKCDICRLVYDDYRRLAYDENRPEHAKNILFDIKEPHKHKRRIII